MVSCFCSEGREWLHIPRGGGDTSPFPEVVEVSPPPPRRGPKQKKGKHHPAREYVPMFYEGKGSVVSI